MKIAFLSQMGFQGKIPRNHPNMRTEFAQMCALKSDHYPLANIDNITEKYDHVILLIPKTNKDRDALLSVDLITKARKFANKVWFMQEGPSWIFHDMSIAQQFWHYNLLVDVDGILTENKTDIPYFKGLVGNNKPIHDIPSLMIEDAIDGHTLTHINDRKGVIIGGNFVRWYGGFDSYIIARELEIPISSVSMGRKQEEESSIPDIKYLPYLEWNNWVNVLSNFKYAVHLMPTIAAGTFSMNCAYLGIPCIGYKEADTQRILHPKLSVKMGDLEEARKLINKLKEDEDFYNECSQECLINWKESFNETSFLNHMNKVLL
tara:strand:- start:383 stop:1339 length:957 start_codon:yes stop_codon:yes gene_type:complete